MVTTHRGRAIRGGAVVAVFAASVVPAVRAEAAPPACSGTPLLVTAEDSFRLWYNDNADHIGPRTPRLVSCTGNFTAASFGPPKLTVHVQANFTYTTPGTYFAALRATSQRDGDPITPFARVQNLGRVRIVVHG
jgi:hypothetical protein